MCFYINLTDIVTGKSIHEDIMNLTHIHYRVGKDKQKSMSLVEKQTNETTYILYDKEHYYLFHYYLPTGDTYCKFCGDKYTQKNLLGEKQHICKPNRVNYKTLQIDRKKGIIQHLYFDIETRKDHTIRKRVGDVIFKKWVATELSYYIHETGEMKTFFGLNCIADFLGLLKDQYEKGIFFNVYSHNGGRFDMYFLLEEIYKNNNFLQYFDRNSELVKGSKILFYSILGHKFYDTYNFMIGSLSSLCDNFKVETKKITHFIIDNVEFSSMGLCLAREELGPSEYIDWLNENTEYKNAYIEYCEADCKSLCEVHQKFCQQMENLVSGLRTPEESKPDRFLPRDTALMNIKIRECVTLPSYSNKVLKAYHTIAEPCMKSKNNKRYSVDIHSIADDKVFSDVKKAKIGGISHVAQYGHFTDRVGCADVVSLYVSAMINYVFPYGEEEYVTRYYSEYLGIYRVTELVNGFNDGVIQDIPASTKDGRDWEKKCINEVWITNIDIERIRKHGGSMNIQEGYIWRESTPVFRDVLSVVTNEKQRQDILKSQKDKQYNPAMRECCKLFGNSLFGKQLETSVNYDWSSFRNLADVSPEMMNNANRITHCNNQYYIKTMSESKRRTPVQLGVFILAYSRNLIQGYFDIIGRERVIATETDSIYATMENLNRLKKPDMSMVYNPNQWQIDQDLNMFNHCHDYDKQLGNMEIEPFVSHDSYFLAKKTYGLLDMRDHDGTAQVKDGKPNKKYRAKGVPSKKLNDEFYQNIFTKGYTDVENIPTFKRELFSAHFTSVWYGETTKRIKSMKHNNTPHRFG